MRRPASRCSRRTCRPSSRSAKAASKSGMVPVRAGAGPRRCGRGWPPGPASGMPSSMPMVRIGIWAPRSAMKSKPPLPTSGSRVRAQNSRILGSRAFILRGVNTRDSRLPVDVVVRRVLEDDGARGHLDVGLDQLEQGALAGDVGLPVDEATARRRRTGSGRRSRSARCSRAGLVPQALPDGIGIGVDLEVVRVVVDARSRSWSSVSPISDGRAPAIGGVPDKTSMVTSTRSSVHPGNRVAGSATFPRSS